MLARLHVMLGVILILGFLAGCGIGGGGGTSSFDTFSSPGIGLDVDEDAAMEPAEAFEQDDVSAVTIGAFDRRVIRSGELALDVSDVSRSVRHAREVAEDFGGFIADSTSQTMTDGTYAAELTLEVPTTEFETVMDVLQNGPFVTRVAHESTSSRDVTEEYLDLRSRLTNLEATELRFVALLEQAHTIDDILRVERELTRVRGEIEQIQGRINYLEQRTDFSRIHVTFHEEAEPLRLVGWEFEPGQTAREAWANSMQFLGTLAHAVITVTVFLWWFWPLVLLAALAVFRYRRGRRMAPVGSA